MTGVQTCALPIWDWNAAPWVTLTDHFGMNWTPDFTPLGRQDGGGPICDWYYRVDGVDLLEQLPPVYNHLIGAGNNAAQVSLYNPGIGFEFDIVGSFGHAYSVTAHRGRGSVIAHKDTPVGQSGQRGPSITTIGQYFHETVSLGLSSSITFGGGATPTLGFSPAWGTSYEASDVAAKTYLTAWYWE